MHGGEFFTNRVLSYSGPPFDSIFDYLFLFLLFFKESDFASVTLPDAITQWGMSTTQRTINKVKKKSYISQVMCIYMSVYIQRE